MLLLNEFELANKEKVMKQFCDIFEQQEMDTIDQAPQFMGTRHPTWFPLFYKEARIVDNLVNVAVKRIAQENNGEEWLRDLKPRLLDFESIDNASSALAEIRVYGGLLEAGFSVQPIPRKDDKTPDFNIDAGDGQVTVEVFAKHQDKKQDELLNAAHSPNLPLTKDVERSTFVAGSRTITTTIVELTPAGKPDPDKPFDSIQANMISRVCSIKQSEGQLPSDRPSLLVVDFTQFGGANVSNFLKSGQTSPIESGHQGITCGAIWYALYGWKGAPVFEEGAHKLVRMMHDGRFRLKGQNKTKISAVLVVFHESAVLLENPWAAHKLPFQTRLHLCRFPWFDLTRTIAEWQQGDIDQQIAIHKHTIDAMEANYSAFWEFP